MMTDQTKVHIRRILAPNPSMMTGDGTNTYIIGTGLVAVIDPGPAIAAHQDAIFDSLGPQERISHIFVTHAHLDHSALARPLSQATGAPILAYGPASAGQSPRMQRLASQLAGGGGEGVDRDFFPDILLGDGDRITAESWSLSAIHTPGHFGGHLCFAWGDTLFSGDHVMGWSTSLISPPDGDMTDYMASLHRLAARRWHRFCSGHGAEVTDPAQRIADLIAHRRGRETALLATLAEKPADISSLTEAVYPDLAPALIPAARRNTLAHLIDLEGRNQITATPALGPNAIFSHR